MIKKREEKKWSNDFLSLSRSPTTDNQSRKETKNFLVQAHRLYSNYDETNENDNRHMYSFFIMKRMVLLALSLLVDNTYCFNSFSCFNQTMLLNYRWIVNILAENVP